MHNVSANENTSCTGRKCAVINSVYHIVAVSEIIFTSCDQARTHEH